MATSELLFVTSSAPNLVF